MATTLVDSNVLLDIATDDAAWSAWSARALERAADESQLAINALIYAEVSVSFSRIEDLEQAVPSTWGNLEPIPSEAAFLGGKAFLRYRRGGGMKNAPLPDFVCDPVGQIHLRTRFYDAPGRMVEHETLVEGGGNGR